MPFNNSAGSSSSSTATLTVSGSVNGLIPLNGAVQLSNATNVRHVFGTVSLTSAAGVKASISGSMETAPGNGVYRTVFIIEAPVAVSLQGTYCFAVPTTGSYKFNAGGGVGVTETHVGYSFINT